MHEVLTASLACPRIYIDPSTSTRRSNSAKPEDLVKELRAHLPKGLDKKYLDHETQMTVAAYEELIADILLRTLRPGSRSQGQKLRHGPRDCRKLSATATTRGFR